MYALIVDGKLRYLSCTRALLEDERKNTFEGHGEIHGPYTLLKAIPNLPAWSDFEATVDYGSAGG